MPGTEDASRHLLSVAQDCPGLGNFLLIWTFEQERFYQGKDVDSFETQRDMVAGPESSMRYCHILLYMTCQFGNFVFARRNGPEGARQV